MKKIYAIIFLALPLIGFTQATEEVTTVSTTEKSKRAYEGWNKRISIFVGAGASYVSNDTYELPVIDKTTNNVIIETSGQIKPNVSMGIVYTPFVYNVHREVSYYDSSGVKQSFMVTEHVPKHFSVALFINPINLTSANSGLDKTVDLGFGLGWRSDNFAIFATTEFFGVKQPRNYFIEQYKGNDKPYVVAGETQTAININDNSIFKTKIMTAFGIKIAYTFDIASKYSKMKI